MAQVIGLQKKFRSGGAGLTISLMVFLKNWLERHIAGSDQQSSAFIGSRTAAWLPWGRPSYSVVCHEPTLGRRHKMIVRPTARSS
jgi:hypothetical protein